MRILTHRTTKWRNLTPTPFLKYAKNYILLKLANNLTPPGRLKNWILRRTGAKISPTAIIAPDVIIDPLHADLIIVDEHAFLGWGCRLFVHCIQPYDDNLMYDFTPIYIGERAFIGGFTTIRGGCVIGDDAIVGSDSLVLTDVLPGSKVWGVPAKVRGEADA